jgi:hypothetical protein
MRVSEEIPGLLGQMPPLGALADPQPASLRRKRGTLDSNVDPQSNARTTTHRSHGP